MAQLIRVDRNEHDGMDDNRRKVCRRVAQWWRWAISNPKKDNGDPSPTGGMTMVMAMMLTKSITATQAQAFEDALYAALTTEGTDRYSKYVHSLNVDYGPCETLANAARDAGILSDNFPWKTNCFIDGASAHISHGYGAPSTHYMLIDDGRFFVTRLTGTDDDMAALLSLALSGVDGPWAIEGSPT